MRTAVLGVALGAAIGYAVLRPARIQALLDRLTGATRSYEGPADSESHRLNVAPDAGTRAGDPVAETREEKIESGI